MENTLTQTYSRYDSLKSLYREMVDMLCPTFDEKVNILTSFNKIVFSH